MVLDELAVKINTSQVFMPGTAGLPTLYQKARFELIENVYLYLQSLSSRYSDMGLEIVETIDQCLKSFNPDKGSFLNYFMLSMKRRYARSIAENATVIKRGGIHLSKADQKSIAQLKCLARHLHCALDEEKFPRKASAILSVAEDEIRRLLQLNQEAVILPTGVSDEDANILDLLPAGDNVELEMENRDTVSRFLSCVEKRFQSCQQRQKIAISPLLSAKILSYYPEVIDYINPASHSFFDQRMFKCYCETGEVPSAREISLSLGRSEASTSRSLKSFLEEVRKCMERPL